MDVAISTNEMAHGLSDRTYDSKDKGVVCNALAFIRMTMPDKKVNGRDTNSNREETQRYLSCFLRLDSHCIAPLAYVQSRQVFGSRCIAPRSLTAGLGAMPTLVGRPRHSAFMTSRPKQMGATFEPNLNAAYFRLGRRNLGRTPCATTNAPAFLLMAPIAIGGMLAIPSPRDVPGVCYIALERDIRWANPNVRNSHPLP